MREEIANLQSAGQEGTTPDEALASSNDERLDTNLSVSTTVFINS